MATLPLSLAYEVYLDGFSFYARYAQNGVDTLNDRTKSNSISVELAIPPPPDNDLVVASGDTYTVASGTIEYYDNVTVDGTLDVNGILLVYGTLDSVNGTVDSGGGEINTLSYNPLTRLLDHDRHSGSYTLNGTLGNVQRYKPQLPDSPNINSLVVGLEPATDLQNRGLAGKWGLISNITDSRTRPLTNPVVTLEIDILADYAEYSDVTSVQNDLEI